MRLMNTIQYDKNMRYIINNDDDDDANDDKNNKEPISRSLAAKQLQHQCTTKAEMDVNFSNTDCFR